MSEQSKQVKKEDKWYAAIAVIISVGAIVYATVDTLKYRTWHDIFVYALYISLGFVLVAFALQIISWIRKGFAFKDIYQILIVAPIYYILGITFYIFYVSSIRQYIAFWSNIKTFSSNHFSGIIIFVSVLIALILFYFRLKCRSLYGLTEFIVGIFISANQVSTEDIDLRSLSFYRIMLISSIYLMIRGLDNIYQGLNDEKKPDKAAKWVLRKLRLTNT